MKPASRSHPKRTWPVVANNHDSPDSSESIELPTDKEVSQEEPSPPEILDNAPSDGKASACPNCGAEIAPDSAFCNKCGKSLQNDSFTAFSSAPAEKKGLNKGLIIGIAVAALAIVIACIVIIPQVMATPDDLIKQGKYEQAYDKATSAEKGAVIDKLVQLGQYDLAYKLAPIDKKEDVIAQLLDQGNYQIAYNLAPDDQKNDIAVGNIIAYISNDASENLKDPSSFELRDAYYDGSINFVLRVSANNSYGAKVTNYFYYKYMASGELSLFTSFADFDEDKIYERLDSESEQLEKLVKNAAKSSAKSIVENSSNKVGNMYVKAVNDLFSRGKLSSITLITEVASLMNANKSKS